MFDQYPILYSINNPSQVQRITCVFKRLSPKQKPFKTYTYAFRNRVVEEFIIFYLMPGMQPEGLGL